MSQGSIEARRRQRSKKKLKEILRPFLWTMWNHDMAVTVKSINKYIDNPEKQKKPPPITTNMRKLIRLSESQNHRCCYCHTATWHPDIKDYGSIEHTQDNLATLEHVLPRSKGGTYATYNLIMACNRCNVARGNMPIEEYMEKIETVSNPKADRKERKEQFFILLLFACNHFPLQYIAIMNAIILLTTYFENKRHHKRSRKLRRMMGD